MSSRPRLVRSIRVSALVAFVVVVVLVATIASVAGKTSDDDDVVSRRHRRRRRRRPVRGVSPGGVGDLRVDPETGAPRAWYRPERDRERWTTETSPSSSPEDVADAFLRRRAATLMLVGDDLARTTTTRTTGAATVRYEQRRRSDGVPVYGAGVVVTVSERRGNVVSHVASTYEPVASTMSSEKKEEARVSREAALRAARREAGATRKHVEREEASLVVYVRNEEGRQRRRPTLAWRVRAAYFVGKKRSSAEYLYDARTGEILLMKSLLMKKRPDNKDRLRKGRYRAATRTRTSSTLNITKTQRRLGSNNKDGSSLVQIVIDSLTPQTNRVPPPSFNDTDLSPYFEGTATVFLPNPLATARAVYTDKGYGDDRDRNSPQLEAALVKVTLPEISPRDDGAYVLEGPYAALRDFDFPKRGCVVRRDGETNFSVSRDHDDFEGVSAFFHIDRFLRYLREDLSITDVAVRPSAYEGGVRFDPHGSFHTDNSYYDLFTQSLAYGVGGVDDAEDADVVVHELAHGVHQWITHDALSNEEGLSDGVADYLAASYSRAHTNWTPDDEPQWNWLFGWDGHNCFWDGRSVDYSPPGGDVYPKALVGDPHVDGQIWATCAVRLRDVLGREITDTLVIVGLSYLGQSSDQDDAAHAVLEAARNLGLDEDVVENATSALASCGYSVACGNGVRDEGEECDGDDLGNNTATCADVGCSAGTPTCDADCRLDRADCRAGDGENTLRLVLTTDLFPEETTWTITNDADGTVLYESGPYFEPFETHQESVCFRDDASSCHTFTIYDGSWQDGLQLEGDYDLYWNGVPVNGTDPDFGASASHRFGESCGSPYSS